MTELENLMVEKMKEILANQTRLTTQLDELSEHLKSVRLKSRGIRNYLRKILESIKLFFTAWDKHRRDMNKSAQPQSRGYGIAD